MSTCHFMILLAIAIITTIRPTLGADIDAGPFVQAAGYNEDLKQPWHSYCSGNVKIVDDTTIVAESFNFSKAPWGQIIAFSKDPYAGTWPNADNDPPMKNVRPVDAVFVKEGIPNDDVKCYSFSEGADFNNGTGTLKVKAADGKKLTKETKFIGVYCLRFNILFCRVDVTGKLDGITAGDAAAEKTCSAKFTPCWYEGGDEKCKDRPPVPGNSTTGSPVGGAALPVSSKWTPLLSSGLVVVMLAFPHLISGSPRLSAQ